MSTENIQANIPRIREGIEDACVRSGRGPEEVTLMAVTKTRTKDEADAAYSAGIRVFGENRVQEAEEKYGPDVAAGSFYEEGELHLIGHLQSNKAKSAAGLFSWVQSIEKPKTAAALDRCLAESAAQEGVGGLKKTVNILLELNTSGEDSKFGYTSPELMYRDLDRILEMEHLRLRGLMTIGPFTADEDRIRRAFGACREEFEHLRDRFPKLRIDTLSMGMSGDYRIAVEEGSTLIRVGTTIFGKRV